MKKRGLSARGALKWTALALVICGGVVVYVNRSPRREPGFVPWTQGVVATSPIPLKPASSGPFPAKPGMPLRGFRTTGIVDLNSAGLAELQTLPGMTADYAQKIIAGRPFHGRADLVRAGIPGAVFDGMSPPAMMKWDAVQVDLNSAPLSQLQTLPGMTADYAKKIIAGRPFHGRADLERAGIPGAVFDGMSPPAMMKWDAVPVDLNSAPLSQLQTLPGMTGDYAEKIIAGRPFHGRADLERAGIPGAVIDGMSPPAMIKFAGVLPER